MFNKKYFSEILTKIYKTYNNQRDFADSTGVNRAYLSQYMNQKLDNPPTPKILERIANASHNITNYEELMFVCGYTDNFLNFRYLEAKKSYFNDIVPELKNIGLTSNEIKELRQIFLGITFKNKPINKNIYDFISSFESPQKENLEDIYNQLFDKVSTYINEKTENVVGDKKTLLDVEEKNELDISTQYYMCPVYGQISAGQPNWAEENIEGRIPIDTNLMDIVNPEEHFFLRVNGESMNKIIKNGAFALIHKQDAVENGEIAVVLVNGFDATLKKFTKQGDLIILEPQSNDESFETQVYDKNTSIKILGKYVGKMEINK